MTAPAGQIRAELVAVWQQHMSRGRTLDPNADRAVDALATACEERLADRLAQNPGSIERRATDLLGDPRRLSVFGAMRAMLDVLAPGHA